MKHGTVQSHAVQAKPALWLVDPWDALPGELGFERGTQVARALVEAGYDVIWWQTGFSHAEKQSRCRQFEERELQPGIRVRLLPARPYASNVGFARLLSIFDFAMGFTRRQWRYPAPAAVYVSGPVFFLEPALLALKWCRGIPLVFEFRDLWPETIIAAASGARWARWLAFAPMLALRRAVFGACDGIVGLNRTYLERARREAGRSHGSIATAVAYPSPESGAAAVERTDRNDGQLWVVSSGTLGASHDHATLLAAAATLRRTTPSVRFLVTGTGPNANDMRTAVDNGRLDNVVLLGALPGPEFRALLQRCDVGLALYRRFSPVVMPTKIVDYVLAGLSVVTSASGEGGEVLRRAGAGVAIPAEDPAELIQVLQELANDPARLAGQKQAARALRPVFSRDAQIARIRELVTAVACRRDGTVV